MDHLWTPWRYAYVTTAGKTPSCIFCELPQLGNDEQARIVHRGQHCYVVLNTYPYTAGHVMVVPFAHLDELQEAARRSRQRDDGPKPANGAGIAPALHSRRHQSGDEYRESRRAGVAGHIHMHVLPRWVADANFMSTVGETRILPETLEMTYQRIKGAMEAQP